jgi:hypothetical protein
VYIESLQQTDLPEYKWLDLSFLFSQYAVSFTSRGNNIVCDPCNLRWGSGEKGSHSYNKIWKSQLPLKLWQRSSDDCTTHLLFLDSSIWLYPWGSLTITGSDQSTKPGVSPTPAVSSSPAPALHTHFSVLFLFLDLEHFKQYLQNFRILCPSTDTSVTSENHSAHGLSSL